MKKTRLFDFSVPAALAAMLVLPLMVYFCYSMYRYQGKLFFGILLPFVVAGCIWIVYNFGFRTPLLEAEGVRYKALFIPRERIEVISEYDTRFKEPVYYIRNKDIKYGELDLKEVDASQIRVQATMANTRKLTEYTHQLLTPAKKPKYRWKK